MKQLKDYSLSNYDILDIEPNIKITLSSNVSNLRYADEMVNQQGLGILLFQFPNEKNGHWMGLIRKGDTFEVFDSYGNTLSTLPKALHIPDDGTGREIENLIKNSGYKIIFNPTKLQKDDNTCGRWVLLRLLFSKYKIVDFLKILRDIEDVLHIKPLQLAMLNSVDIDLKNKLI